MDFKVNPVAKSMVVTPSDDNNLEDADGNPIVTTSVRISSAGALKVLPAGQTLPTTYASGFLAAGLAHPLQIVRVYDTGTDVDVIVEWN